MSKYKPGDIIRMGKRRYVVRYRCDVPPEKCYLEELSEKSNLSEYSTMALLQELAEREMRNG